MLRGGEIFHGRWRRVAADHIHKCGALQMRARLPLTGLLAASLVTTGLAIYKTAGTHQPTVAAKPDIILILIDDLGYADLSCQGSTEVRTPRIDLIARDGVRLTSGYVSAPQCAPSRAGLITGRYQNRFGFETNFDDKDPKVGLPSTERTIAEDLSAAGYATGIVGKWHLGASDGRQPYQRGFQEALWTPNGGINLPSPATGVLPNLFRMDRPVTVEKNSTDAFADAAVDFIARHRGHPFFLYLSFVAPHWPMEAEPDALARFRGVRDVQRRTFLAMMATLDAAVGRVLDELHRDGLDERTLLVLLSDNGGATGKPRANPDAPFQFGTNTSLNLPFRGEKSNLLEGGIRIPFMLRWTGHLPAGVVYDQPAIALDLLPTFLTAAHIPITPERKLDGVDLIPFLSNKTQAPPHERLFWRFRSSARDPARQEWAVREGDWKLIKSRNSPVALYNLSNDPGERTNLIAAHPELAARLDEFWRTWNVQLQPPAWQEPQRARSDPLDGWYGPETDLSLGGGSLIARRRGAQAVIANASIKATEPNEIHLHLLSGSGGLGTIRWRLANEAQFQPERTAQFAVTAGSWQDLRVPLSVPAGEFLVQVRIEFPATAESVEIDRIELNAGANGSDSLRFWTFDAPIAKP
jgi:arylsulfatase A-like enzyme